MEKSQQIEQKIKKKANSSICYDRNLLCWRFILVPTMAMLALTTTILIAALGINTTTVLCAHQHTGAILTTCNPSPPCHPRQLTKVLLVYPLFLFYEGQRVWQHSFPLLSLAPCPRSPEPSLLKGSRCISVVLRQNESCKLSQQQGCITHLFIY